MRLFQPTLLLVLLSCGSLDRKKNKESMSFEYPKIYDTAKYIKIQKALRSEIKASYEAPDSTMLTNQRKHIVILFKESCLCDSFFSVPARFNLDIKEDFLAHGFKSRYQYILAKDTIIDLVITKDLFFNLIDSNLTKYGILKHSPGDAEQMILSDSFHLYYTIEIPGTMFQAQVVLAGDSNGNFRTYNLCCRSGKIQ